MKIGAVGHIKVFRITLKSGAGKSSLPRIDIDGVGTPSACCSVTIRTDGDVATKRLCDFGEEILQQHRMRNILPGTHYGIANSIANLFCCFPRDLCGLDQAGYR